LGRGGKISRGVLGRRRKETPSLMTIGGAWDRRASFRSLPRKRGGGTGKRRAWGEREKKGNEPIKGEGREALSPWGLIGKKKVAANWWGEETVGTQVEEEGLSLPFGKGATGGIKLERTM